MDTSRIALCAGALVVAVATVAAAPAHAQDRIRLTFVSDDAGLAVHRHLATYHVMQGYTRYDATRPSNPLRGAAMPSPRDLFERLCDAPCTVYVEPGAYHFGVSRGHGMAFRGGGDRFLDEAATFRIGYEDRTAARVAGWVVFLGGLVAALGFVAWGAVTDQLEDPLPWVLPAIGSGVLGMGVGIPLIALTDGASVERLR